MDPKTRLVDGNSTFRNGADPSFFARLAKKQEPFVAIVSCSDSRVDPVKIFNLSLGDAFVVRVAGNCVCDPSLYGSLEYAVSHLKVRAVLVMGHTDCGAVKASYECGGLGSMECVIKDIQCAKSKLDDAKSRDPDIVAETNVRVQLRKLMDMSSIIRDAVHAEKITLYGAMFDIKTGTVRFI